MTELFTVISLSISGQMDICGSSRFTKTVEDSDPDDMWIMGGTINTFTVEDNDPDEFNFSADNLITEKTIKRDKIYEFGGRERLLQLKIAIPMKFGVENKL